LTSSPARSTNDLVIDSLRFCQQKKGLELFVYCLMTNHLHLIARAAEGALLSDFVRNFKKFTSRNLFQVLHANPQESRRKWLEWIFTSEGRFNPDNTFGQVWQNGSHAVALQTESMARQRLEYVHRNPVRAGTCYRAEDYVYSSAAQYAGLEARLPVALLF
jgi:putative transposase